MVYWGHGRRGPSTLLRTIPSHVEGWRALVVGFGKTTDGGEATTADAPRAGARVDPREARATESAPDPPCGRERRPLREEARCWADLMRRTFGIDVLACPCCGGRFRLIAVIEEASVVKRILCHLHLPTEVPTPRPGRAPPLDVARGALSRVEGRR
jgi:hypothetical protein